MLRWLALAAALAAVALLALALAPPRQPAASGLVVVVTVHGLGADVAGLLCPGDTVAVVAPTGDPHAYQLRPGDVELLRRADLLVVTGHMPFERRASELTRAVVVDAVAVSEVIHVNPATGSPNLHAVYYDPRNLARLLRAVTSAASALRPECRGHYAAALDEATARLRELIDAYEGRFDAVAAAEGPEVQYAVEWMGVRVSYLLKPEHDTPPRPADVRRVVEAVERGLVDVLLVVEGSEGRAAELLRELAGRYGVPLVEVPSPFEPRSTLDKLVEVASRLEEALGRGREG